MMPLCRKVKFSTFFYFDQYCSFHQRLYLLSIFFPFCRRNNPLSRCPKRPLFFYLSGCHTSSDCPQFTKEKKARIIIIIPYVILMQTVHTPTNNLYYYPSPVKSDPDTETDESQSLILRPTLNLPTVSDQGRSKVKSSLCKNFATQGFCPYGKRCQFAHGPEELRCNENINTSYKTKPCFSFRKQGYCPYGHRCNFQHRDQKQPLKNFNATIIANFPEIMVTLGGAQSRLLARIEGLNKH